jgi:hypothetical protein
MVEVSPEGNDVISDIFGVVFDTTGAPLIAFGSRCGAIDLA